MYGIWLVMHGAARAGDVFRAMLSGGTRAADIARAGLTAASLDAAGGWGYTHPDGRDDLWQPAGSSAQENLAPGSCSPGRAIW